MLKGTNCDRIQNPCISSPCKYGACSQLNSTYNYVCTCAPGYTGVNCDSLINLCASSPCVRGICNYRVNYWYCVCPTGFSGLQCENQINNCDLYNPACLNNGTCINQPSINSYSCILDVYFLSFYFNFNLHSNIFFP